MRLYTSMYQRGGARSVCDPERVTRYQLAWDDTRTGRVRSAEDDCARPFAWLRLTWAEGHELACVDVYGDGASAGDRKWLKKSPSIRSAVEFCHAHSDELTRMRSVEPMPEELGDAWEHHSELDVP